MGALGVAGVAFGAIVYLGQGSATGNVWGPGGAPPALMATIGTSIVVFFWAFAKAKSRSGWLGVLLPLLSIIGLVILLALKDKSLPEAKQGGAKMCWPNQALQPTWDCGLTSLLAITAPCLRKDLL